MEIVIKNNRFVCRIYDMDSFIEMPLKNVRKLWKLMFAETWRNEESIERLKQWIPNTLARVGNEVQAAECDIAQTSHIAEMLRQKAEDCGPGKHGVPARKAARAGKNEQKRTESICRQKRCDFERMEKLHSLFMELNKG